MNRPWRILGILLALAAGGYFLVHAYHSLSGQDLRGIWQPSVLVSGLFLTLLYALLIPVTALAWALILRNLDSPMRFGLANAILATTQFGKYLPGNVAHHLGRVVLAKKHGVSTGNTVMSMSYEILLTLLACAHVSAITLLWEPPGALADWPLANHRGLLIAIVTGAAILGMALLPRFAGWVARRRAPDSTPARAPRLRTGNAVTCYLLYVANFALVGVGLWVCANVLTGSGPAPGLPLMIGAFASSWILGFLAPGAPAGLGVREAVLTAWMQGSMDPVPCITLVIVLRIATTLGDLANFIIGGVLLARQDKD